MNARRSCSCFAQIAILSLAACASEDGDGGDAQGGDQITPSDVPAGPQVNNSTGVPSAGTTSTPPAAPTGTGGAASPGGGGPDSLPSPDEQGATGGGPAAGGGPPQTPIEPPVTMTGGTEAPPVETPPTPRTGETCLQPGDGSYEERGPYGVGTMDVEIGDAGMFTIFYPEPLEADCPHPIVAWGNGTAVEGSAVYAFFNDNAAAWGMVVAASHNANTGTGRFHTAAIDYLLAENENPSSMFYQKLSTRAGTSGHSQGGFGATAGAAHPNVETQVSVGATGSANDKVSLLVLTGTADLGPDADALVLARASGPAFVAIWDGGDHFTTETLAGYIVGDPGSLQMQRLYAAWFRCFLADDVAACQMFEGAPDSCGICNDSGWHKLAAANL